MMIRAHLENAEGRHLVSVGTGDQSQDLTVPPKSGGRGSSVNGGRAALPGARHVLLQRRVQGSCERRYRDPKRGGRRRG